jgi:putative glycosyltransferase (TIGR04372 family)
MIRLYKYILRQVGDVRVGGITVLLRKIHILIEKSLYYLTIPIAIVIVLLKPIVLVRFGTLRSNRIGHFTGDVESYLCDRSGKTNTRTVDIIGCPKPVCNSQLRRMWERNMRIIPGAWLWTVLDQVCRQITKTDLHHVYIEGLAAQMGLFLVKPQHISFIDEEERRGQELLEQMGIPADAPWVCIHNRDSAYLTESQPAMEWGYHDYRDFSAETMASAAEELARRGYYVLRMGSVVAEPFIANHSRIIDYANHSARNDFADIFLLGKCKFYLGSDSGIIGVPAIFRKPYGFVNFPSGIEIIFSTYYWNPTPFLIKRVKDREQKRFLSLREMFEVGLANVSNTQVYDDNGCDLICNTSSEIRDLAIEIDERLKDEWLSKPEDEALQQQFWNIVRQYSPQTHNEEIKARIGTVFLRNHADLLD